MSKVERVKDGLLADAGLPTNLSCVPGPDGRSPAFHALLDQYRKEIEAGWAHQRALRDMGRAGR
jgi:hypothetical protein